MIVIHRKKWQEILLMVMLLEVKIKIKIIGFLKNQNITEDFRGIYRQLVEYDNNTDWNEGISKDYLGVPMDAEWILTGQDSDTNGGI